MPQNTKEGNSECTDKDLWSLVLSMDSKDKSDNKDKSVLVGPTYKIEITVKSVLTGALLDHGAQVTIVRRQLLGKVKERQKWPVETCRSKEIPLEKQPIGATGTELGAVGAVRLNMVVDATQANQEISCFVLDSSKPLWQGELQDCVVLLGTNALIKFGIEVIHSDGTVIIPSPLKTPEGTQGSQEEDRVRILQLSMEKTVHLMPQQSLQWMCRKT